MNKSYAPEKVTEPNATGLPAGELSKLLDHPLIDRALERHDQFGKVLHRLPAPLDEFRLVAAAGARDVDFGVLAGEAHREPFLALAAIAALPGTPGDRARDVVDQPVADFGELLHRPHAGLHVELAAGGIPGVFAGIDAALRHLPDMGVVDMLDAAGTAADEDQPVAVDQHDADAGAIGQILITRHSANASCDHTACAQKGPPKEPARCGEPLNMELNLARF